MPRCVLDTSICVDLANAGLLQVALRLSHTLKLPDVIAEELNEPPGSSLVELGFGTVSLPDVQEVATLVEKYRKPSTNDLFALACAKGNECILLTGDADLRKAAEIEKVEVHGILWVLDELVKEGVLSPVDAVTSLERVIAGGSWLPQQECEERLKRWRE
jgi:predicted nucleic acid-binding protein